MDHVLNYKQLKRDEESGKMVEREVQSFVSRSLTPSTLTHLLTATTDSQPIQTTSKVPLPFPSLRVLLTPLPPQHSNKPQTTPPTQNQSLHPIHQSISTIQCANISSNNLGRRNELVRPNVLKGAKRIKGRRGRGRGRMKVRRNEKSDERGRRSNLVCYPLLRPLLPRDS